MPAQTASATIRPHQSNGAAAPKLALVGDPRTPPIPRTDPRSFPDPAISRRILSPAQWQHTAARLGLSPRELEAAQLIFDGHGHSGIAYHMNIKPSTVRTFIKRIYRKANATDHRELVLQILAPHIRQDPDQDHNNRRDAAAVEEE